MHFPLYTKNNAKHHFHAQPFSFSMAEFSNAMKYLHVEEIAWAAMYSSLLEHIPVNSINLLTYFSLEQGSIAVVVHLS